MQTLKRPIVLIAALLLAGSSGSPIIGANCQLPDDIQRELNQNLAEQARIQALQARQQQLQQAHANSRPASSASSSPAARHDPNNYSYQQVSPPVQYSYYQPFGDAAGAPQQANSRQSGQPVNIDLNNLDLDNLSLPQPQAQVSSGPAAQARSQTSPQQHYTPSFTGVGGLPVMKPIANSLEPGVPVGASPLAPQARVQQGPPLTEADFKDITGGENYGAPGGNDFGLGSPTSSSSGQSQAQPQGRSVDSSDGQLGEFGMPLEPKRNNRRLDEASAAGAMSIPDFGAFNPISAGAGAGAAHQQQQPRADMSNDFGDFGNLASGSANGNRNGNGNGNGPGSNGAEFDFAGQPSSRQSGVDQAGGVMNGGAPGSLQSLLGASFPGLGSAGNPGSGLDEFARAGNNPQAANQRQDDGAMDMADLGEKADGFSGADLGGFEQPGPQNDRDFNYGAGSEQQPKSVPYPDGGPQPVGTLWALSQPQSLSQSRYNALPDKGTYQDYPAYASGGNDFGAVGPLVDDTPAARPAGPGRYGTPSSRALAAEVRQSLASGQQFNYGREPASVWQRHQPDADRAGEFDFTFE